MTIDIDEVLAVPPDTRVSFTVVTGDDSKPTIAAMQYSFIGPPLGGQG
jgi:hypothetical protein